MIGVTNLSVNRGGDAVLDGVTIQVDAGECVGLLGPNGAGKTTLIQCLNGALDPAEGAVRIDGRDLTALSAAERGRLVGTVPQQPTIPFEYTVETVVAMGRTPYVRRFDRMREEDRSAVRRAMERTETAALADRSITTLSGGERQRVMIARALAQDPLALLLDEPTSALDIDHETRCLELATDLASDHKAIVMAIHDIDLAARFCDRLVLLSKGSVVAEGRPESVLEPDLVERVFGVPAAVVSHPATGTPTVVAKAGADGGTATNGED